MVNQVESDRLKRKMVRDWDADLDDRSDRAGQLDDVPLRLTEERIRAETERVGNVEPMESASKASSAVAVAEPPIPSGSSEPPTASRRTGEPAPVSRPELAAGPGNKAGEVSLKSNQPARTGSILGLDSTQLRNPQSPAAGGPANRIEGRAGVRTDIKERKNPGRFRVLRGVAVALALALAAESGYAYLAIRRNSVNVSQLPGTAVLRALAAEIEGARSKLQQSSLSANLNAVGHEAGAALNAAYQGARRLAGEVRDRYNQRHGR